jgi:PadR family transcriptional regulator PadR
VVRRLRAAGLEDVGDASVYGTLRRLYAGGYLTSYVVPSGEGPHRKYYAVNDAGRALLAESAKTWRSFTDAMDALLGLDGKEAA